MAFGPEAGLEIVEALSEEPSLKAYHLLPSVRGDLLFKLGRYEEARVEFERAATHHTQCRGKRVADGARTRLRSADLPEQSN